MTMEISAAHNTARLQATLTFANTGTANPTIEFYATTRPAFADASGGAPLVVVTLAKPCGSVAGGVLSLIQADPAGDLVTVTGSPLWARWLNGDGVIVAEGNVSDDAGAGDFRIAGTSGVSLYAGGSLLLGTTALG